MQHQRPHLNLSQPRPGNSTKTRFQFSLENVRKHIMPKKLHLQTDMDVENPRGMPQSNKHAQSTKNKSSFKRHSRQNSDINNRPNLNTFLLYDKSTKPSKRHSLKDDIHHISINRSTFIGRRGTTTNNNSIDKINRKADYSPYKESISKYRATKPAEFFKSKQASGKIRRNLSKLKTQESKDDDYQTKQATLKTTPENYNLINAACRPKEVLGKFAAHVSLFQQAEILEYEIVYFVSKNPPKQAKGDNNLGFDDDKGRYNCKPHEHIAYRYEVIQELGRGSFGQVYRAFDYKHKCQIALKIIRNKKTPSSQARIEYGILKYIKQADEDNCLNVVQVKQAFLFRKHFCMTFEILSYNLYQLIKINKFLPLSSQLVRRISIQVLSTLLFLYKHRIIHCDIKPENILLKTSDKSGIKIIDFGSSCFSHQKLYTYIQSRYYRAPQVILGHDYSVEIDMWSFGCVAAQLKLSYPIFSGEDQAEQVALITEVIGMPDEAYYGQTEIGKNYFGKNSEPLRDRQGVEIQPRSRLLSNLFSDPDFADFLTKIFVWDPKERLTPLEALRHNWIVKGLPSEIRQQHSQYLAEQQAQLKELFRKQSAHRQNLHDGPTLSEELLNKALRSVE